MEFNVLVETPRGSRNKYEMNHETGRLRLDRMLFTSTSYPCDYGYIPGTLAEDGDLLDALVLGGTPTFPGCEIHARAVAVFWMNDELGPDAKVLAVPANDPRYSDIQDLSDVPEHTRDEIWHFFDVYKDLEPQKSADARGWQDRVPAEEVLTAALARTAAEPTSGPDSAQLV